MKNHKKTSTTNLETLKNFSTIYTAVENAVLYNQGKCTDEFWLAASLYCKKLLNNMDTTSLNTIYGFDYNNDDLASLGMLKFVNSFNYLVDKYHELHKKHGIDEASCILEFNKILPTLISSMNTDLFRHVSYENKSTSIDSSEKKAQQPKRIVKGTYNTLSFNMHQGDEDQEASLLNLIPCNNVNLENQILSREEIMNNMIMPLSSPCLILAFFALRLNISLKEMYISILNASSIQKYFIMLRDCFAIEYDLPQLHDLHFSNEQFTYPHSKTGLYKKLSKDRNLVDERIKKYSIKNNLYANYTKH